MGTDRRLTTYRHAYKIGNSFEYPEYFEIFKKCRRSIWSPEEVQFGGDIRDWQSASEDVKEIVGGVLRGFTQLECHVRDYWAQIPEWFPKHEIAAVANEFSASESVHAWSYNFLSENLGLDEFEAFLGDPIAREKIDFFLKSRSRKSSLAIFSGAAEGVSLFSSFAILLSLNLTGKFKGLAQIISWSALDEGQHSTVGSMLFRELCKQDPLASWEEQEIIDGFQAAIDNEFAFLDQTFLNRKLPGDFDKEDFKQFALERANNRIANLGIDSYRWPYDQKAASRISSWFYPLIKGNTSTDFFAQSKDGALYVAKPTQNFGSVDLKSLDYALV